jgi:hypothetical protein
MKNIKALAILITIVGVSMISAYYDQYGTWHETSVEHGLDTLTGGRYSDTPEDTQKRKEANWKRQDKERSAQRKYQKDQAKIQEKKEARRGVKPE